MSRLFILRHGEAENYAASGLDSDRNLTERGRAQVNRVLSRTAAQTVGITLIIASPYRRTQQTAERVKVQFPNAEYQTWQELIPESNPQLLCEKLQTLSQNKVLMVSHQPLVGTLVNGLCGCEYGRHPMDTASFAGLEVDVFAAGMAELLWLEHA